MSKKIGIITIHSVYNYGAMLQAFALSKYIESIGYDSEVIDYRPYWICRNYNFHWKDLFLDPRRALGVLKQASIKRKRFDRFKEFLNNDMPKSNKKYDSFKKLSNHNYDILVTGSDQIWNPGITNADESFLLLFDKNNSKKVSYSSSFGVSDIPDYWRGRVKLALNKFDHLGVREQSGVNIINSLLPGKDVNLVLDPVFLLSTEYWREKSDNRFNPKEKYLLVYSLEVNDKIIKYALSIAREKKLKIVTLHPFKGDYGFADICINEAGPKEFISLIDNAEFVVTNSFHGTAFSLLLNKPFSCVLHSKTGTRMSSLLERLGMDFSVLSLVEDDIEIPFYVMNEQSQIELNKHIELSKGSLMLGRY
jgi:hypothetical protein